MIANENLIRINQSLVGIFQPDRDLYCSARPWLKNFEQTLIEKWCSSTCFRRERLVQISLTFCNQTLIEKFWADFGFNFSTTLWFENVHRDHVRDWKDDPDRSGSDSLFEIDQRFWDQNRILIYYFQIDLRFSVCDSDHDRDWKVDRIDQDPVFNGKSILDFSWKIIF